MVAITPDTAGAARLSHERYCDEIVAQTDLLRSHVRDADMTTPVPSCPGWNLGQLLRHVGGAHRMIEEIVRTRSIRPAADDRWRDLSPYTREDAVVLDAWLADGATALADTLRAAGPDAEAFNPVPRGAQTAAFSARRMTHETLVHRADAALAIGVDVLVEPDVAVDAIDEWMELGAIPELLDVHPEKRQLLELGQALCLRAIDTDPAEGAGWTVDLAGDVIGWRRGCGAAAASVTAPLTELLLVIYRRRPLRSARTAVSGDARLLDTWYELSSFG